MTSWRQKTNRKNNGAENKRAENRCEKQIQKKQAPKIGAKNNKLNTENKMDVEKYLDSIGAKSSAERLAAIAGLNLGERSEAAARVLKKRQRRRELMDKGLSFAEACMIVNEEQKTAEKASAEKFED